MQEVKDRIMHLMKTKNINAAQLAEVMNVQRSGISHILSGRNKPGTDFIIKLKESFPEFSLDWLLMGKGPATISPSVGEREEQKPRLQAVQPSLFDDSTSEVTTAPKAHTTDEKATELPQSDLHPVEAALKSENNQTAANEKSPVEQGKSKKVIKVIFIYADHTFSVFEPSV
ncbi:MAG TPA: helix-turn-helix transcriptional regulator [Bacteroidales bacterium]|nr:helix-turn-helix transcriptional regulator [Bacteroidales bacterium]